MGAGRRTESHTGSHPPTLSPDSAASFGPRFLYLSPQNLASVIFGCTNATIKECLETMLFGLPYHHIAYVQNVQPGMPLFLFNYSDRKLHGIFEAASLGQIDINPHAWANISGKTPYSAQVQVRVRQIYPPLPESVFKQAIATNYHTDIHFAFELDETQTKKLVSFFTKGASSVGMKPQTSLTHKSSQEEEEDSDGWIKPKKTIKSAKNVWQNALPFIPATHKSLTSEAVSTEVRPEHWEDTSAGDVYSEMSHTHSVAGATHETYGWEGDEQTRFEWDDRVKQEVFAQQKYTNSSPESAGDLLPCQTVSFYGDKENKEPTTAKWEHKGKQKQRQQRSEKLDIGCNGSSSESDVLLNVKNDKRTHKQTHCQLENLHNRKAQDSVEIPARLTKEPEKDPAELFGSEKWVEGRCVREQVLQGEEYEQQRGSLQEIDSSVANVFRANLEFSDSASVLMKREGFELKQQDTSRESVLLNEVDQLRQKNAVLEHNQGRMVSEIECLKLQMVKLSHQLEALQQQSMYNNEWIANDEWIVKDILDEKAASHGHRQNIYLLGGNDGESWLQNADVINPVTFEVAPMPPMLFSRLNAAATVLMGQIYVFGGGNGKLWYETAEYFDNEKNEWLLCSPMSIKRGSLAGATLGDRIYALGGGNGQINFSEVESYDFHIGMWMASTSMLNKRFGVAAAELDGALYAIGGYNDRRYLTSVERYDPREALWTLMAPLHQNRGSLSAAVLGGKIYAIGGYDGANFLSSVEVYESRMNSWVEMENGMQLKRSYGSAAVVGDSIYMFGGYTGRQYIQTVERYHVNTGWEIADSAVVGKRCFHAGVVL